MQKGYIILLTGIIIMSSIAYVMYKPTIIIPPPSKSLMGDDGVASFWMGSASWEKLDAKLDIMHQYGCNSINMVNMVMEEIGIKENMLTDINNRLKQRNMKLQIQPYHLYTIAGSQDSLAWRADFLKNIGGVQDIWIDYGKQIITKLQPDLINVFGEFWIWSAAAGSRDPTETEWQQYITFVCKAVDAWRTIKSDLTVAVMSMPWWDLKPLINHGGIPRPNIVYTLHYYYAYLYNGNPPSVTNYPECYAYWTNAANKKTLLRNQFLNNMGIQSAINAGKTVWFEALGTNINNPNAVQFCRDAVEFCNEFKIDYVTSGNDNGGNGYPMWGWIWNQGTSILNNCGIAMLEGMS
jgi:hypothetical protein